MSDSEYLDDTEQIISESHSKLLEAVSQLDKNQRVKKAERSEPTLEVSEFHLVKSGISDRDAVYMNDLSKALGRKGHHLDITKNIKFARNKSNILKKPLEKPVAERIKRIVGFENAKKELNKWNAIITRNRVAGSLQFPMNQSSMRLEPSKQFVKRFRLRSELEEKLAALEPQKENIEEKVNEFSSTMQEIVAKRQEAARIRAQQSYKESKSRRERKIKSKKFHRYQKKKRIKVQLKEFEELQKTDPEAALEKLEQLDKSRAEERMSLRHKSTGKWAKSKQIRAKYDKDTRQELAQQLSVSRELTLKFKKPDDCEPDEDDNSPSTQSVSYDPENPWTSTNKSETEIDEFVKNYRKYWDEQNNRSENQKLDVSKTDKNESDINKVNVSMENINNHATLEDEGTNCTKSSESNSSENEIMKKKPSTDDKKLNRKSKLLKQDLNKATATSVWSVESVENLPKPSTLNILNNEEVNNIFDDMEEKMKDKVKLKLQQFTENYNKKSKKYETKKNFKIEEGNFDGLEIPLKNPKPIIDSSLHETIDKNDSMKEINSELNIVKDRSSLVVNKPSEIDPTKYINVEPKRLNTGLLEIDAKGGDALDDSENDDDNHNIISEAFADDDVIEEFRKEKQDEVEKFQPKDIDLTIPGWGNWYGKNIKVSKQKKRRFILKFPKDLPRKDENKGDVIILEENNKKLKEHQVNELPFPFTSVKDYEASLRMPIGRNFVPEISHRKLIEPIVKTSMGKVIEPMDENVLLKQENKCRSLIHKKRSKVIKKKRVK
ncbi:U3 small nucleolar RNA-associated protein 14 homolog A [Colletes latitarsis]|uniref:U3 small nucleolar RNA-associated protein 14 homolog A n=1 Tax=Colletes latitarsis TaxID=2605962 RepID=UPI004036BAD3